MISKATDWIFPFAKLYKSTKQINKKITGLNNSEADRPYSYEYASNDLGIEEAILIEVLNNTIENKKILEDKAKSSLIAITISSTLMFNITKYMQDIKTPIYLLLLLSLISFLSLAYMISAGILSLYSISEINTVSLLFPEDYLLGNKEKYTQIADNTEYNYLNNMKRNNFMNTSYRCVIISISLLVILFIMSILTIFQQHVTINEFQILGNEIQEIEDRLSELDSKNIIDRQSKVEIQQILLDIIQYNAENGEQLRSVKSSVKDIDTTLHENFNDIKFMLEELNEELKEK